MRLLCQNNTFRIYLLLVCNRFAPVNLKILARIPNKVLSCQLSILHILVLFEHIDWPSLGLVELNSFTHIRH